MIDQLDDDYCYRDNVQDSDNNWICLWQWLLEISRRKYLDDAKKYNNGGDYEMNK